MLSSFVVLWLDTDALFEAGAEVVGVVEEEDNDGDEAIVEVAGEDGVVEEVPAAAESEEDDALGLFPSEDEDEFCFFLLLLFPLRPPFFLLPIIYVSVRSLFMCLCMYACMCMRCESED